MHCNHNRSVPGPSMGSHCPHTRMSSSVLRAPLRCPCSASSSPAQSHCSVWGDEVLQAARTGQARGGVSVLHHRHLPGLEPGPGCRCRSDAGRSLLLWHRVPKTPPRVPRPQTLAPCPSPPLWVLPPQESLPSGPNPKFEAPSTTRSCSLETPSQCWSQVPGSHC